MAFDYAPQLRYGALEWLGYPPDETDPSLNTFRTQADADEANRRLAELLDQLLAAKQAIEQALPDSMAVQIDTLQVNYNQHLAQLQRHGWRLTQQLSELVVLPVRRSYFKGQSVSRLV